MNLFSKKNLFKYFLLLGFISLFFALFKNDFLEIPILYSLKDLLLAYFFLILSFFFLVWRWERIIHYYDADISFKDTFMSIGLSIFGKYIPGKIWSFVGKAIYLQKKSKLNGRFIFSLSVYNQIVSIWGGILIGSLGFLSYGSFKEWNIILMLFWIFLSVLIFTNFLDYAIDYFNKIFKKNIEILHPPFKYQVTILPIFILDWLFRCIGFYFLIKSITLCNAPFSTGFGFAFAQSIGIIAFFVPGGLGVREGILVAYLIHANFPLNIATMISIFSRLWFLSVELLIFLLGVALHLVSSRRKRNI